MRNRIPQISSLKSRPLMLSDQLVNQLTEYSNYLSETAGVQYECSDIIAHALQDEKGLAELPVKTSVTTSKITLKLPHTAWLNLDRATERTGLRTEKVLEEMTRGLLRDRSFLSWLSRRKAHAASPSNESASSGLTETQAAEAPAGSAAKRSSKKEKNSEPAPETVE